MATADSLANGDSKSPASSNVLVLLWRRWLAKRRRDRARLLSQVRFRLTREGVHFIGILIFIFIGAVIRDINLLILLAGTMIGLLLLQWRFNTSTLVGLQVARGLSRTATVGQPSDVDVVISNPKRWLSAWLVLVEDPIRRLMPYPRRLSERGTSLVDAIRPLGSTDSRYRLEFHERGRYRIGPSTLSTRFPLGLGRGWRTVDNAQEIVVHPRQGKITPAISELFNQDRVGQAKASANSGAHQGEFYGLRPWESGDSRRWIHWRTTARLGELSVRQFEHCQQRQSCVLLDLYDDRQAEKRECAETAISFLASVARTTVIRGHDKLSVGVAGRETSSFEAVQSTVLVNNLLDELAIAETSAAPDLAAAFQGLSVPLLNHPHLVVISTREDRREDLVAGLSGGLAERALNKVHIRWLDVSQGDLEPYIQWT